ncbi:hypothetical protein [Deinococcus knuensis]|uniref:Uncharacterized protein n=1 Tax=Deinococcus knuensis TaxID=1837380 RepID=A0ABQ2SL44_9DEIO|nr:hypothetical protein [Deinococcus knuensis]GGS32821.1 hypothetical protein GCM10008961_25660 [Deinococcus knuensis]
MTRSRRTVIPTETLLNVTRNVARGLTRLSRDPQVRRDAEQVAEAVSRLLTSICPDTDRPGTDRPGTDRPGTDGTRAAQARATERTALHTSRP